MLGGLQRVTGSQHPQHCGCPSALLHWQRCLQASLTIEGRAGVSHIPHTPCDTQAPLEWRAPCTRDATVLRLFRWAQQAQLAGLMTAGRQLALISLHAGGQPNPAVVRVEHESWQAGRRRASCLGRGSPTNVSRLSRLIRLSRQSCCQHMQVLTAGIAGRTPPGPASRLPVLHPCPFLRIPPCMSQSVCQTPRDTALS